MDLRKVLGRPLGQLSAREATDLAGLVVALERYTPKTTPLVTIEAIGHSAEECIGQLLARGLDPRQFEFTLLKPPY